MLTRERADQLFQGFQKARILVVGDFMLDEYIHGRVDRISPEAPVPIVVEDRRRYLPGGAGNVVQNLAALGAEIYLAGQIGDDPDGQRLKDLLLPGCRAATFTVADRCTTRKTRILAGNQQVCRLDTEKAAPLPARATQELTQFISSIRSALDGIIISDYDKGVVSPSLLGSILGESGPFVAVDPQIGHFSYYKRVSILTPNHHEAGSFLGRPLQSDSEVEAGGREILEELQAERILITRGEKGMSLISRTEGVHHIPTRAREVFDVTGAGDTVISVLTLAMVAGATSVEAMELSNAAAGIVVGRIGAASPSIAEIRAVL
ncbi:MAG: D-glycero-beta-D-manno-heptose-7-phosphate kinase [Spirochaetales bacterium]|nr:D-glycero-beta-D-manno-heptose-7-phosphate kinase [Spirochaetales bacterium]